jgi:hypothetical protein
MDKFAERHVVGHELLVAIYKVAKTWYNIPFVL